jgi:hypothetical protein
MEKKWFSKEHKMRKRWFFFVAPPALVLFIFLCGEVVMHLWNWLLPMLFGWHQVTFWQALGLLLLCRILFGGFGGHGSDNGKSRRSMNEHWKVMTPEERERFRSRWHETETPATEASQSN